MTRAFGKGSRSVRQAWIAALLSAPLAVFGQAQAAGTSETTLTVLAEAKAATGGAAWDRISGWHERGRHGATTYETFLDFRRYGARFASTRGGSTRVHGFNGSVVWDLSPDGKVVMNRDPPHLAEARQSAYGSTFAFFFPRRFPARFEYLGAQADAAASFDVVRVTPRGSTPMEVWVDRSTHLIARFVDRTGPTPVTANLSDYRQVGDIRQPFRIDVGDGDPTHSEKGQVESVVLESVARNKFDPPV
jgi:hypothetical protein